VKRATSAVERGLLHPITLAAIALLLVNDHLLKERFPGLITGKLSDAAGLTFYPLLVAFVVRGRTLRAVVVAGVLVGAAFACVKLSHEGRDAYASILGAAQWLVRVPSWWLRGVALPSPAPAVVMRDPSDLVTLPFLGLGILATWLAGRPMRCERADALRARAADAH